MTEPSVHTTQLHRWLEGMRSGDRIAQEELLQRLGSRLERLARKMLHRFPDVHRWAEADDVLQNSLLRLLRALREVQPRSMRDFFGLAAEQMRRELLDLARHFNGPHGLAANQASPIGAGDLLDQTQEPVDPHADMDDLDKWSQFHEAVERLPAEEREVVGLVFYHGWTQAEVAELFQVSERTVRRRWETALEQLQRGVDEA
jgi:RNA polymerase sigma factor (sigma-70 family)